MRSTSSKPWLSLITLLLLGSGLGWYLAMKDEGQHWLIVVAAWAGASAGTLAMPFFELLAKLLANLSRRTVAAAVAIGISIALALATRSILITGLGVGEVVGNVFFLSFVYSFSSDVFYEAHYFVKEMDDDRMRQRFIGPTIFSLTIFYTVLALNSFEFTGGIARFASATAAYVALIYATARVDFWMFVSVRPATNYSAFQSLQTLALIFGVGLGLGWVTTSLLI